MDIQKHQEHLSAVFGIPGFKFNEERHTYTLDGNYLPSVTGLTKRWKKPFDRDAISARVARRDGRKVADVLKEWELKADTAAKLGTEVHAMIESYWKGEPLSGIYSDEAKRRFAAFLEFRQAKLPNLFPVAQELRIFSRKYGAAGTLDFLGYNRRDSKLYIFDWKTNGNFRTDADKSFDKLLPPFDDLDDNDENNYSLQLSFYKLFLREEAEVEVGGCMLVHLPPSGANARLIEAKDLSERLAQALAPKLTRAASTTEF